MRRLIVVLNGGGLMQDVRSVDPKAEKIRKAMVLIRKECEKYRTQLALLKEEADALQVVQEQGGASEESFMFLRDRISEAQRSLTRYETLAKALPEPCSGCGGTGIAGAGMGVHTCRWCNGVGFRPPGAFKMRH
ncbi:MAG: hypothetical protein Q8P35_02595 [Candidatus Yanofskybacteria bacterium]|nr:hypothetical protein [Candidatus Yanofskybacteria bacterium]